MRRRHPRRKKPEPTVQGVKLGCLAALCALVLLVGVAGCMAWLLDEEEAGPPSSGDEVTYAFYGSAEFVDEEEARPPPLEPARESSSTIQPVTERPLISTAKADALALLTLEKFILCQQLDPLASNADCAERAINVVCENEYGDAGWLNSEELECRDDVRQAVSRLDG